MDFDFGSEITDLNKVPSQFRGLYQESEDGKIGLKSDDFTKGAAEAIVGLSKALKTSRKNLDDERAGKVDLGALSSYGASMDEIVAGIQTEKEELEKKIKGGANAKIEVDKALKDRDAAHKTVLDARLAENVTLLAQLKDVLMDGQILSAIGDKAHDASLLMPFVKERLAPITEDGKLKIVVVDETGSRRFSTTGGDLSIAELVTEMKSQERFGRLFKSEASNGSHMPPGGGNRFPGQGTGTENKSPISKITSGLVNLDRQGGRTRGAPVPVGMK